MGYTAEHTMANNKTDSFQERFPRRLEQKYHAEKNRHHEQLDDEIHIFIQNALDEDSYHYDFHEDTLIYEHVFPRYAARRAFRNGKKTKEFDAKRKEFEKKLNTYCIYVCTNADASKCTIKLTAKYLKPR